MLFRLWTAPPIAKERHHSRHEHAKRRIGGPISLILAEEANQLASPEETRRDLRRNRPLGARRVSVREVVARLRRADERLVNISWSTVETSVLSYVGNP